MMALRVVSVLALALVAASAQAQTTTDDEMVVSGPAAAPPPSATGTARTTATGTSRPLTTDEQIKAWISDAPKLDRASATDADASLAPRQVHGSAGVSVGSGGYSSAYVASEIPLGKTGTLGIAVSQTDYGNGLSRHGRGYGYGYGWPRGRSQSVAVSLDMSNGRNHVPADCPGFSDGDRYIEPVWMTRLHPEMSCSTETEVHSETDPGQ